jgi:hypothetical protein
MDSQSAHHLRFACGVECGQFNRILRYSLHCPCNAQSAHPHFAPLLLLVYLELPAPPACICCRRRNLCHLGFGISQQVSGTGGSMWMVYTRYLAWPSPSLTKVAMARRRRLRISAKSRPGRPRDQGEHFSSPEVRISHSFCLLVCPPVCLSVCLSVCPHTPLHT